MTRRTRRGGGRSPARPTGGEERSPEYLEQVEEIEDDRRSERWLLLQSLLAMLFVVVLVVVGRWLFP